MTNEYKMKGLSEEERKQLISRLIDELPVLRTKLGLSQAELADVIHVSRQTYSSIESRKRKMSWNIFLSLILVFDTNRKTHNFIRKEGLFPQNILMYAEDDAAKRANLSFLNADDGLLNNLDDQAIHAIETVIMIEYARCNNLTGDAVIKAFNGKKFIHVSEQDIKVKEALQRIKNNSAAQDKK